MTNVMKIKQKTHHKSSFDKFSPNGITVLKTEKKRNKAIKLLLFFHRNQKNGANSLQTGHRIMLNASVCMAHVHACGLGICGGGWTLTTVWDTHQTGY